MTSPRAARLGQVLRSASQASDPDLRLALGQVARETQQRLRSASIASTEYFRSIASLLLRVRGTGNASERIQCLLNCCQFFYVFGKPSEITEPARQAALLARSTNDRPALRKSLTLQGVSFADLGLVGAAVESYSEALEIARSLQDAEGEYIVLNNLGLALMYGSLYRDAITCLERACDVAEYTSKAKTYHSIALSNLGSCYLFTNQLEKSLYAIQRAIMECPGPENAAEAYGQVLRVSHVTQLLLELGHYGEARKHVPSLARLASLAKSPRADLEVEITTGLCDIYTGSVDRGVAALEGALSKARSVPSIHQDALIALVKGYDAAGQPEVALVHLKALSDQLRSARRDAIFKVMVDQIVLPSRVRNAIEDEQDLASLKHREALLRAKVAERELVRSRQEMLERLAVTADLREDASGEHGYRVGKLSALLAEDLGWNPDAIQAIELTARLHDIGKIGVPDRILLNSEELKVAERHLMSAHTLIGVELLSKSNIPQLRMAEEIARSHHEWWNGSGYPSKLSGKRIPLHARIVALADVFDAITHGRPYEQAWPMDRALEQIRALRGEQFDPDLTDRFLAMIEKLRHDHADLDEYLGLAGRSSPFLQARRRIRKLLDSEERSPPVAGNQTQH